MSLGKRKNIDIDVLSKFIVIYHFSVISLISTCRELAAACVLDCEHIFVGAYHQHDMVITI